MVYLIIALLFSPLYAGGKFSKPLDQLSIEHVVVNMDGHPEQIQQLAEFKQLREAKSLSIVAPLRYDNPPKCALMDHPLFPKLKKLRIEGGGYFFAPAPTFSQLFVHYFGRSPLKSLTISGGWIDVAHMENLAKADFTQNLEELVLINLKFHYETGAPSEAGGRLDWLKAFPNLRVLKMVECRVGDREMKTLPLSALPHLREVNIAGNAIGACEVLCALAKKANRNLNIHGRGMFTTPHFKLLKINQNSSSTSHYYGNAVRPWDSRAHYKNRPACRCSK